MTSDEKEKKTITFKDEVDEEDQDAEFNPDDEDDESFTYSSSSSSSTDNYITMHGSLHISNNDEGKVVYNGTWSRESSDNKKFKLKSKQSRTDFDLKKPLFFVDKEKKRRTLLMDGFFWTVDEDGESRKVKERDVELTFCAEEEETRDEKKDALENGHVKTDSVRKYEVKGRGCNEFGGFVLEGVYSVFPPDKRRENGDNTLICTKHYLSDRDTKAEEEHDTEKGSTFVRRRRKRRQSESESEEDDYAEEEADFDEVIALNEEANMSVEELRQRYMSDALKEEKRGLPTKKSKTAGEESDEDEYGF